MATNCCQNADAATNLIKLSQALGSLHENDQLINKYKLVL